MKQNCKLSIFIYFFKRVMHDVCDSCLKGAVINPS